jgi:hypothetical protein
MLLVRLVRDPLALDQVEEHEVAPGGLQPFLQEQFPAWPETARIYRGEIAIENDVTPTDEHGVNELEAAEDGTYHVVVYPGDPITILITVVATLALTAVVLLFLTPKIPSANMDSASSNNSLGNRVNKPRPNERIPDIFGRVMSIPEMLTFPITTFEDNVEVEVSFMCVGRGSYDIERVRDGGTPLTLIAGAGAEFYAPGTSPNFGAPQLTVGTAVDAPFRDVIRLNEVNGQQLDPPNRNHVTGQGNIRFVAPNFIENSGAIDFTDFFGIGDDLTVVGADFGTSPVVLDATTQIMRFHSDKRIEFQSFDPSTLFSAGQTINLTNATFAGEDDITGEVVYINVSGQYEIDTVDATTIQLV